jgi:predicted metal-binding membrane protein
MTAPHWLALYAGLVAAWTGVWALSTPVDWGNALRELSLGAPEAVGLPGLVAMWLLMSAAMMLPTALPAFATHDDIADAHGTGGGARLVAGYGAVWIGFAVLAAGAQLTLSRAGLLAHPALAPALLLVAAGYQVSAFKEACLSRCRQPLTFFMQHWAEGPWRMGLRLGGTCLGCCWALMALGLIGGAMSLGFMALATLLMCAEKLSSGVVVPRAIALGCLGLAGYLIGGTI